MKGAYLMVKGKLRNISLQTKLMLLIFTLFLIVILVLGTVFNSIISNSIEEQIGKRALGVAETIAVIPAVRSAFRLRDPEEILQPLAEEIQQKTGAQFIVIGNTESIRYTHPNPEQIGKHMVGGDNSLALEDGLSYISHSEGTLGPSIRGKTPVFNDENEIVGIVSVGFLNVEVNQITQQYKNKIILLLFLFLCISIVGAYLIAKEVKRAIFGLEPREIGLLFEERNAILQSIHEGIIAINEQGFISTINEAAYNILHIEPQKDVNKKHILDILPNTKMLQVLEDGKNQFNQELTIDENQIIASRIPILTNGKVTGVVASFRKKTDIEQLSKELSQVQQYAEVLRSQTHEYSNKLYTISGLIQLKSFEEALDLINMETRDYQDLIHFLLDAVPDKLISAILLGKYTRAHELHVNFRINKESSLRDIPTNFQREKLVTILGNLLDNAFEAVLESPSRKKDVHLFMTDLGTDYIFEIDDSGIGITDDNEKDLFTKGFSTKNGEDRGHGLHLVKQAIQFLNGYITVSESALGGLSFVVVIPKEGRNEENDNSRTHNGR